MRDSYSVSGGRVLLASSQLTIWLMVRQASSMLREASAAGLGTFRSSGRASAWG
jgi:hypothetical protein